MRTTRRVAALALLAFLLSTGLPSNVVRPGGEFPLSWLWSWAADSPAAAVLGLPVVERGPDGRAHYVPADATRARGGSGRAPERVKEGLPAYSPHVVEAVPGAAGTDVDGFDAASSKWNNKRATSNSDVYANVDGSVTQQIYGGRQNYKGADGVWRPIDTDLKTRPDKRLHMGANSLQVSLANGETAGSLVSMTLPSGQTINYDLQGATLGKPAVTEGTATYANVLPQTDLELVTTDIGVKETLILRSPDAPHSWVFPLRLKGLTAHLTDGQVELRDATGKAVAWMPRGNMQDSKVDPRNGAPAESTAITYELIDGALKVTADEAWLRDPARQYPIRMDPTATTGTTGDVFVDNNSTGPDHNGDNLPVGTWDGGATKTRSFIHLDEFDNDGFVGKRITGAKLNMFLTWAASCTTDRAFNVHAATAAWTVAGLDAGSYPGPSLSASIGSLTVTDPGAACTNTGGARNVGKWISVPLSTATFDSWAKGGANLGLGLTASESDTAAWKRFTSANYSSGQYKPYLELTYANNVIPQVDVRYPGNNFAATTLTPQLVARGHDPDNWPNLGLQYRFYVYNETGSTLIADSGLLNTTSWTVPSGKLNWGKTYLYTVQVSDKVNYSAVYPGYAFATPVPQPILTSRLTQNAEKGFDPGIGNYTASATDATVDTIGPPLAVSRSYNSLDTRTQGALGRGWSSIVDSRATEAQNTVVVTYPDGQEIAFGREANGTFSPPPGRFASFVFASSVYTLTDKDGTVYRFAQPGGTGIYKISSITDANGRALTFSYGTNGLATKMTSASGRSLNFTWDTPAGGNYTHVVSVATDAPAATWQYTYDNDNLVQVCPPTSTTNCNHYEYTWISQYPNAVANQGPYSYWRLNEPAGATMAVSSVLNNAGVDNAVYSNVGLGTASTLDGSTSKAVTFNGTSSYVQLPGKLITDSSYQSLSLWFKTAAVNGVLFSYSQDPISKYVSGSYTPALYVGSDGKLRGEFWQGSSLNPIASTAAVNDDKWHHVVLSGSGNTQTLYVDGVAQGNLAGTIAPIANGSNNVYLGAGFIGGGWPSHAKTGITPPQVSYFNGAIAEVGFFNRALSASTVSELHNIGKWPRSAMTKVIRPSGGVTAEIGYDNATGKVTTVKDENGGTWQLGKPTVAGNSDVYAASVLGGKPDDYWRLGDVPGDTDAVNEVAGGTATYNTGVTLGATGPFSDAKAAKFNGSSSYVELPAADVPTTGPTTISMWFNMPSGNTAGGVLYSYQAAPMSDLTVAGSWTPALYVGTDGKLRGGLWTSSGTGGVLTSAAAVNDGKWHHVALTAGSNSQSLYIDGVSVASNSLTMVATSAVNANLGAGKWEGGWPAHGTSSAGYFPGSISDFAYYSAKLTAQQVQGQVNAAKQAVPVAITKVATAVGTIPMPVSTVEVTDPGGRRLSYSYDVLNGNRLVAQTDALGNTTKVGYDVGGYSNLTYDPLGVLTETISDVRGNTIQSITCQDQAANKCSSVYYTYYPDATSSVLTPDPRNDAMLTMRDGRSVSATDNTYLTTYTYDAKGNQTAVEEPLKRKTVTSYTANGLPNKVVSPSGQVETLTYYANGDLESVTDSNRKTVTYTYDSLGRTVTENDGSITSFTYDAVGRVLTQTEPAVTNRVSGAVHTSATTTTYDVDGLTVSQKVADTTGGDALREVKTTYNAFAQVASETDALGKTTTYEYDAYGKVVKEIEPDGGVTRNAHDAEGNLLTSVVIGYTGDPNNPSPATDLTVLSKAYDPAGRVASETDAMGRTRQYTYTDNGLVAKVVLTDGTSTFVSEVNTYDAAGELLTEVTNNGATTTTHAYDAAGREISSTVDPSGLKRTTTRIYSADDNVLSEKQIDGAGAVFGHTEFMYDNEGSKLAETQYTGTGLTPAGRWLLDQNGNDSSGNNPVTAHGVTGWAADRGGAATLGGGYLESAGPALETENSYTVSAWVYLSDNTSLRRAVSANGQRASAFDLRYEVSTNKWALATKSSDTDDATGPKVSSTSTPVLNTWTHLAATFDATTNALSLYVNGALEGTGTAITPFTATESMMIGTGLYNGAPAERWKGNIDDVQFYQKALTAAEISQVKSGAATGTVVRNSYNLDNDGLAISSVDPMGRVTDYSYDEDGRVIQAIAPAVLAEVAGGTPTSARPISNTGYNTFDDVTEQKDENGNVTVLAYDAGGQVVRATKPSSGGITPVTETAYDVMGQVKSTTDPLGNVTSYSYDQLGRVSKVVMPNGGVAKFTYNLAGELLTTQDPNGAVTSTTYDFLGRTKTSTDVVRQTGASHTTVYTYGFGGWISQVQSPTGITGSATYNAAGENVTSTDGAGKVTTQVYDAAGRVIKSIDPDGSYSVVTYDLTDRALSTKSYAANGTLLATQSGAYDAAGELISTTDGRGHTTSFTYDATGEILSETQPISATDSIVTTFGYDLAGNRTRFTDGRGNKFLTTYNSWGMPESLIEPATAAHPNATDRTFTVSYDAAGRAVTQTQPGGVTRTSTYDAMGNLVKQVGTGAEAAAADRAFGYDLAGRMTSVSGNTLSYDDRGLLLSVTGVSGDSSFGFNGDGAMTTRTDAAGTTSYGYDTAGRLSTVNNAGSGVQAAIVYNTMSAIEKITYGTGNSRQFGYDNLHRMVSDEVKTPTGTSLGKLALGWDANNNIISKTTTGFSWSAPNAYTYDDADRLTSWNGTNYTYDKSGNRTQNGSKAFTYDERNRLLGGAGATYTYTPRGTMRFTVANGQSLETQTDAFGQVAKQYANATGWHDYTYDGLGRVLRDGFAYTGLGNDLASDGQADYTRDPTGGLLGVAVGGSQTLAWTDLHTDVVGQFTATGAALSGSAAYDPLGKVLSTSGMIGSLGYQSEWTDVFTNRVNMHSRWYNVETGQFDTRDSALNNPVPDSINANKYQYGDGNPLTVTDPSGHWGWNPFKAIKKAATSAWRATTSTVSSWTSSASSWAYERASMARSWASQKYHAAKTYVKKKVHAAKQYVKKKYYAAKRYVKKKYNAAKRYVKKKYDQGRKWVAKKYHAAKKKLKQAYHKAKQAGKHIVQKAARNIKKHVQAVKDGYKAASKWVKEHKAQIVGAVVGIAVGIGCGVAIGWTGVGAVACGALAGAAGSLVTGAMQGHTGWELVGDAVIGGTIGAITGGLGSIAGAGIKAGIGAISGGLRSAGSAVAQGMRAEASAIANGLRSSMGSGGARSALPTMGKRSDWVKPKYEFDGGGAVKRGTPGGRSADWRAPNSKVPHPSTDGFPVKHGPTQTVIGSDRATLGNANNLVNEGAHDVIVHGSREGDAIVHGALVNPGQIAEAVTHNPSYVPGQACRLLVCHAGASGLAQDMANILGTTVKGATDKVRALSGGGTEVVDGGYWRTFLPIVPKG